MTLLEKILHSTIYNAMFKKATKMAGNSTSLLGLIKKVASRIQSTGSSSVFAEVRDKIFLLAKLVKCYANGEYKDIALKNIVIVVASFLYLVSPIDLVPDVLPIIGFTDDIALLVFVYNSISAELEKFEIWDLNRNLN